MAKKITIIGMIIVIFLGIGSFFMFPKKEIELKELNEPNITFAYIVDGSKSDTAPKENEGYAFDDANSSCINGTEIYWDTETWSAKIKNLKNTKTTCTLSFNKKYTEGILKGTDPVLGNGMVPITIEDNGVVKKADISTEWYKYGENRWANAVLLADETIEYKNGDVIPEDNIESYFVWIPRYRYQLKDGESTLNEYKTATSVGNVDDVAIFYQQYSNKAQSKAFEIEFENKQETPSTNTTINSWYTHPAFLAFDSNGFWVGKFETGYNQNDDTNNVTPTNTWNADNTNQNIINSSKVIIKPNVYSWKEIQVANAFYTSYEYKRELESHMMKNMEWGAVAYLTQSKYGRCTNGNCEEVKINNSSNCITGYSSKNLPTVGTSAYRNMDSSNLNEESSIGYNYYHSESTESSTTGNYYGVYDMSGGAWEYVMGVVKISSTSETPMTGVNATSNSGFNGPYTAGGTKTDGLAWPSSKYYDLYEYNTTSIQYQRGKLGDATKEMGPFYSISYSPASNIVRNIGSYNADWAFLLQFNNPWTVRGGCCNDGTDAGIFAFSNTHGELHPLHSFRIVLTP